MPIVSEFDRLPMASFNDAPFPVESVDIVGGLRDHVHEYPHADGGAPEKLGRKLYTIRMRANFQTRFALYPGLYPNTLNFLFKQFEAGTTGALVVPTLGTISAYCRNWSKQMQAAIRSGEKADFEFVEDLAQDFLVTSLVNPAPLSLAMTSTLAAQLDLLKPAESALNLYDQIIQSAEAILAVFDQAAVAGNLIEAKLRGLEQLIQQADALPSTQSAAGAGVASALHDLWAAERQMLNDLQNKQNGGLQAYVTPMMMSVQQISAAVYDGDASHGIDIMSLNPLEDPFRVPANSQIRYYPEVA